MNVLSNLSNKIRNLMMNKDTRNLFLFLILNLCFAFVELFYGIISNSLGLISDSFHMFFDCTALLTGCIASIISKWPKNERFTYGYARAEVISGFINGLFLLFVAFFIFKESIERLFNPQHVEHERMLSVSVLGFLVNLIGIFVFNHGHSTEHKCSHHSSSDNSSLCGHSDKQTFDSILMKGVFLHIMADTLGSVCVIISSFLIKHFNFIHSDAICSIILSFLIAISVYPLLKESINILLQRTPSSLEPKLAYVCYKINQIPGVITLQDLHFWTLCSESYVGSFRLILNQAANEADIVRFIQNLFNEIRVNNLSIQIEKIY